MPNAKLAYRADWRSPDIILERIRRDALAKGLLEGTIAFYAYCYGAMKTAYRRLWSDFHMNLPRGGCLQSSERETQLP
jgi:hypothetical protein